MEVIVKNEVTNFDEIDFGQIFEYDHGFFLKINDDKAFDVYNGEIFPFKENEEVIPHHAKLIIE